MQKPKLDKDLYLIFKKSMNAVSNPLWGPMHITLSLDFKWLL